MTSTRVPQPAWSHQRTVFAVFAALAVLSAGISWLPLGSDYARFLGAVPPPFAALVAGMVGLASIAGLERLGWWPRPLRWSWAQRALATGLVVPFAAFVIVFDLVAPFPSDVNVGLPWTLLFYPVMGAIAQAFLHLVPLTLAFWVLRRQGQAGVWAAILVAALVEAVFQAAVSGFGIRGVLVGTHVLAFGVAELWLLRRGGFAAMISFRLAYYLLWHVIWGTVRLASGVA